MEKDKVRFFLFSALIYTYIYIIYIYMYKQNAVLPLCIRVRTIGKSYRISDLGGGAQT